MSRLTDLPEAALQFVISVLLPLILPRNGGDPTAARSLALDLLEDHQPRSVRELRLAGEAVAFSLKSLTALAESAEPNLAAEKQEAAMKWACALSRSGNLAQRRLDQLQGPRKPTRQPDVTPDTTTPPSEPAQIAAPPDQSTPAEPVAQAEAALRSAEKLLALMKAHHKGAPPPHSPAAQQIQAQQRIVDTARMKLQQARKLAAAAALQSEPTRIAA